MHEYKWLSMTGEFHNDGNIITFKGKDEEGQNGELYPSVGNYICNQYFQEGKIKATIEFTDVEKDCACDIIFFYSNLEKKFEIASVGIDKSKFSLFDLKHLRNGKWDFYQATGNPSSLRANELYDMEVEYIGSKVKLRVNGIEVINYRLPFTTTRTQVGIWSRSSSDIKIHDYKIENIKPKAFVVMQFSDQFNELYNDIIKPTCNDFNLDVIRADDIYNNGMIIHDITQNIEEAKVIIADITPQNPNVYYEVGYAHALNKNTILLAEEGIDLPFDVRPYRVIFYKNSIGGKKYVVEKLKMHLKGVM